MGHSEAGQPVGQPGQTPAVVETSATVEAYPAPTGESPALPLADLPLYN